MEMKGCLRIVTRKNNQKNYINLKKTAGKCNTYVGMNKKGKQNMKLSFYCLMTEKHMLPQESILHQFVHAWGFWHEHERPDRDKHVKVPKNERIHNGSNTFGVPYDGGSVMHHQYRKDIQFLNNYSKKKFGQIRGLTECDILKLKKMYGCKIKACKDYYGKSECKKYKEQGKCGDKRIKKLCKQHARAVIL